MDSNQSVFFQCYVTISTIKQWYLLRTKSYISLSPFFKHKDKDKVVTCTPAVRYFNLGYL